MNVQRDPIIDREPSGASLAAVVLVPIGLVVIFAGLCLGGWLVTVVHGMLYQPDQVPLVGKVLELIQKDDVVFQAVQENGTTRYEGAGVRYGILLILLFVVFIAIGSVIKACLTGGAAIMNAGLGRKGDEAGKR
ncbi:MAG: hypothetical protein L0211_19910 [Planctomycetaceae bacterium]|nr:hypothetical protein [Planctomycetaceae bacterium]